ncbi:MAG: DAK2 domain-containing protein [Erysipelotrichaceae bacterium]|nr:DAK2 domain-containing protein [Erysipelotrichaceae bacterium]
MKTLNGLIFKEMLQSGANHLYNVHHEIDALNVFPVPDGDTGTNMSMTFSSGTKNAIDSYSEELNVIAKALSKGLLMGARGNSGVITSQIFRGFYQAIEDKVEINALEFAQALDNGAKVSYKAVMRPVEGTILTVIREASYYTLEEVKVTPDITIQECVDLFIKHATVSLDHTPELLPVLKEVGVVDSGGAGLLAIFKGFASYLNGKPVESLGKQESVSSTLADVEHDEYGYCTEFIIRLNDDKLHTFKEEKLKKSLSEIGNSLVVVQDEELVKVHVHTLTPGEALNIGQRYGEFVKLKIENMQEQHDNLGHNKDSIVGVDDKKNQKSKYALISVAAGDGLVNLFKELRCDHVISGGQTMNPSTEDFVAAIKKVNAEHIFLLPNNSNIIMAAKQAATILEDCDIHVIETRTLPEGISACLMFNPELDVEANLNEMKEAVSRVVTGQVTYAIKDTTFEGLNINKGDYMAILGKKIVVSNPDKMQVLLTLLDELLKTEGAELLTVLKGEDASEEELNCILEYIEAHSDVEVEVHHGNQPVYSFVFGIE